MITTLVSEGGRKKGIFRAKMAEKPVVMGKTA